jgi:phosphatidylglycerophosphatase A
MAKFKLKELFIKGMVTFLGVGYLPFIPGTFGSLVGLIIFFYVNKSIFLYGLFTVSLLSLGFLLSGRAERILGQKDHCAIIIDEIAGMLLSLLFIPFDLKLIFVGFFLFRLLDTLKPYPAGKIQNLAGSIGVMGDDIIAGLYTNLILQVVSRILLKL